MYSPEDWYAHAKVIALRAEDGQNGGLAHVVGGTARISA